MLKKKVTQEKKKYIEIFLKAQDEFFIKIDEIKQGYKCNHCYKCCQILYTNKTPGSILKKKADSSKKELYWKDFFNTYIPFGYKELINEADPDLDLELNHKEAARLNADYVEKVKQFEKTPVFYYCKNFINGQCSVENNKPDVCLSYPEKLLTMLHPDCSFLPWQDEVDKFLRTDLSLQIYQQVQKIDAYREKFKCNLTGTCCRLSSSEFSHEDLLTKAQAGDKFAQQFTSIFIPYKTTQEAREHFPEYVDYVIKELGDDENVYFYHCPHIDENNLCTIYTSDKRPQICADFPSNPLSIMPPNCGYIQWKREVNTSAMLSHAMIEICTYTLEKIERIKNINED